MVSCFSESISKRAINNDEEHALRSYQRIYTISEICAVCCCTNHTRNGFQMLLVRIFRLSYRMVNNLSIVSCLRPMSMFHSIYVYEIHWEILLNYSMGVNVNRCHCLINLIFSSGHAQIDTTTAYNTAAAIISTTTAIIIIIITVSTSHCLSCCFSFIQSFSWYIYTISIRLHISSQQIILLQIKYRPKFTRIFENYICFSIQQNDTFHWAPGIFNHLLMLNKFASIFSLCLMSTPNNNDVCVAIKITMWNDVRAVMKVREQKDPHQRDRVREENTKRQNKWHGIRVH